MKPKKTTGVDLDTLKEKILLSVAKKAERITLKEKLKSDKSSQK
jgi:hypothetical protein